MVYPVLKFLAEQLNAYIDEVKSPGDLVVYPYAILQNIARLDEKALANTENLIISLLNISEESTLKNNPEYIRVRSAVAEYGNAPLNVNLFIMVSAIMTKYENALTYLSHALTFFQGKNTFNRQNSITEVDGLPEDFHIILDIYSLTFEQLNYVWSTLGGKQYPFICYKLRLLKIERDSTRERREVIREIRFDDGAN